MAGNTRGKIKEELEGCHRNFDWLQVHLEKTLILIKEHNPKLSKGIEATHKACTMLDEGLQKIYAVI